MMMVDDDGGDGDDDDRGDGDDDDDDDDDDGGGDDDDGGDGGGDGGGGGDGDDALPAGDTIFLLPPRKTPGKGGRYPVRTPSRDEFFYTGRFNDGVMSTSLWENLFSLFEFFFKT